MSKELIIIKLGGSVVTDKQSNIAKPNLSAIKSLSQELAQIYLEKKYKIILVHGAGSFAHPLVKKFNIHKGMKTPEQIYGFCLACKGMLDLNLFILNQLLKNSLPAVSLSPRSFVQQSAGKFNGFDTTLIDIYLKNDQIPLLFGDMVLDDRWGCSVLSGDTIVSYLAKKFGASKVIFLSDVDGIFDSDPKKNPNAKLIEEVNNDNLAAVIKGLTVNNIHDVTGEMKKKIIEIKNSLSEIEVVICNGLKVSRLSQALLKKKFLGSRILLH